MWQNILNCLITGDWVITLLRIEVHHVLQFTLYSSVKYISKMIIDYSCVFSYFSDMQKQS